MVFKITPAKTQVGRRQPDLVHQVVAHGFQRFDLLRPIASAGSALKVGDRLCNRLKDNQRASDSGVHGRFCHLPVE